MFTGIVEDVASVRSIGHSVLEIGTTLPGIGKGQSVAVNGVCLTVTGATMRGDVFSLTFDYTPETAMRTNLGDLKKGAPVNLERALRMGDSMGGHMMTGHIEGNGRIVRKERLGNSWVFGFKIDPAISRYVVPKGSVGIDGISLTVVDRSVEVFTVSVIPHTMEHTNLGQRKIGDRVNIEPDILAKYVESLLSQDSTKSHLTEGFLRENGFIH